MVLKDVDFLHVQVRGESHGNLDVPAEMTVLFAQASGAWGHFSGCLLSLSNGCDYRTTCSLKTNSQDLSEKSEILIPSPHKVSVSQKVSSVKPRLY